jgi:hypothetical protein
MRVGKALNEWKERSFFNHNSFDVRYPLQLLNPTGKEVVFGLPRRFSRSLSHSVLG